MEDMLYSNWSYIPIKFRIKFLSFNLTLTGDINAQGTCKIYHVSNLHHKQLANNDAVFTFTSKSLKIAYSLQTFMNKSLICIYTNTFDTTRPKKKHKT